MAARRDDGRDYPQYLAFARSLWLGQPTRELKIDGDDQVVVGLQHVQPPVLLEYDKDWGLKSVYLENTSRQFDDANPDNTLAYVDRCTAFEDGSADGDWCALLVNRDNGIKLYRDNDLRGGIAVDAPLDTLRARARAYARHMITQKGRRTRAGQYMLQLVASTRPDRGFWIEAVSSQRKVVLAQQWVQPDANGKINVSFGLDHEVDDLEIRAWLNHAEAGGGYIRTGALAQPTAGVGLLQGCALHRSAGRWPATSATATAGIPWDGGAVWVGRTRRKPVHGGSMAPSMAPTVLPTHRPTFDRFRVLLVGVDLGRHTLSVIENQNGVRSVFLRKTDLTAIPTDRGNLSKAGRCRSVGCQPHGCGCQASMEGFTASPHSGTARHPTECTLLLLLLLLSLPASGRPDRG